MIQIYYTNSHLIRIYEINILFTQIYVLASYTWRTKDDILKKGRCCLVWTIFTKILQMNINGWKRK